MSFYRVNPEEKLGFRSKFTSLTLVASLFKKGRIWYLEFKDKDGAWRNRSTGLRCDDSKQTKQAHLIRSKAESAEIAHAITKAANEGWDWVDEYLQSHCKNEKTLARYLATWELFLFWMSKAGVKCPRELNHNHLVEYIKWRTGKKRRVERRSAKIQPSWT